MKNLLRLLLFPLMGPMRRKSPAATPSATPAPKPDAHPNRVHVFHGTFASEIEATDHCLNRPTPAEVEIIFGAQRIAVILPMLTKYPTRLMDQVGTDNTFVMMSDAAFNAPNPAFKDDTKLRYAGPFEAT